jgi:ABC-type oligopeptide transport system substrate-binding subunit/DNA-binding SARP family transcriptional activator
VIVRVLGPLEVSDGTLDIEVRRPMARALLTLLAAEAGRVVGRDRLIDGLWGDSPPSTAAKALQTHIHHLRSLLPEGIVTTEGTGYRLDVDPRDIDAHRFVLTITEVREATWDDPDTTVERLTDALSWWRGEPLIDAGDADWIRPFAVRLEAVRLQAQLDLADALLAAGSHERAVVELQPLIEEHPLREDLWRRYALALYRSGRQGDALRAFAAARERLVEELGVEPGPELQTLHQQVLTQDPALLRDPRPRRERIVAPSGPAVAQPQRRMASALLVVAEPGDGVLEVARTAVGRFGGTVIDSDERRVFAAFGIPVAREDDTYRAIRASLVVGAALDESGDARCVVSVIEVTVPFQVSDSARSEMEHLQRLLVDAGRHRVLVDDHTRRLMGDAFEWERAGAGGAGPMWRPTAVVRSADKVRLGRRLRAPLAGRASEMAQATGLLESLGRGIGGVMLLSGEAGIGKTRMITELRQSPLGGELTWLVGHCDPYGEATPYWPFRDLVRSWLGLGLDTKDVESWRALRGRLQDLAPGAAESMGPYLGRLLGLTLDPGQRARLSLAPEAIQFRTFEIVAELLASLADVTPLAMVIEDVHWADPTSVELLGDLLVLTERHRILLVVSRRPDPDHTSVRVAEHARREVPHLTTEITLGALGVDDQRSMLVSLLGTGTLPEATSRTILGLAEGNPFYLEELIGSLIDERALVPTHSGWSFDPRATVSVPETVEKVVHARIDRLDPVTRDVLTSASVLGRSFRLPLLQGIVDEGVGALPSIQRLLRTDLLVEARRWPHAEYMFRHALTQEAAYRVLSEERRRTLHRRAAEWLERRFDEGDDEIVEALALHWTAAGVDDRAAEALLRAGDVARRHHALEEAIDHYRRLLGILERNAERSTTTAVVLFRLALAYHTALRFREANDTYQRAFELWSPAGTSSAVETLRFAGPSFYDVPDPVRSYALQDMQLQMALFDRLVERWPDDTIVPSLAQRWDISDDGLTYRFTLRPDVTWSDGEPLTAHDVEFGIKRNLDPDSPGVAVAMLYVLEGAADHALRRAGDPDRIGVRARDDRVVEFKLNAPAPYFLGMLNRPDCGPHPRHAIEARGERWCESGVEVVSGAFHRRTSEPGRLTLMRRPSGRRFGNVGMVEWDTAPPAEVVEGYRAGRFDLAWVNGTWDGVGLERVPPDQVHLEPAAGLVYFVFDHGSSAVADPRLRRALTSAIDRTELVAGLGPHLIPATGGVVPPALAGHTPDLAPVDRDQAGGLAADARPDRPIRVARPGLPHHVFQTFVERAADHWRHHLDLEVEVVTFDVAMFSRLAEDWRGIDIVPSWWYPGYTDPEYFIRLLLHTDGADNVGRFSDAAFDELVERARLERDERTRLGLFHRADRLAVADRVALIPLAYTRNISLHRDDVSGWWEFGKSWANFADVRLSRARP